MHEAHKLKKEWKLSWDAKTPGLLINTLLLPILSYPSLSILPNSIFIVVFTLVRKYSPDLLHTSFMVSVHLINVIFRSEMFY